jgi:hypothetical protein
MNLMDLEGNLRKYLESSIASGGRTPDARYASFDYCFNYFQSFHESGEISALANPVNLQVRCLQLGFYLASWGMLRGSAELLQKSVHHFIPVVEAIAGIPPTFWEVDADRYTESNIDGLLEQARTIRGAIGGMSDILVTKIMLGVFGSVPAFDTYFKRGFHVATFGPKALRKVGAFYKDNASVIDRYRVPTLDFLNGGETHRRYTRAKVIDMAFFIEGMG